MPPDVYVFVDNSNLWIEGKKLSGMGKHPPVPSNYNYRIEYGKLLNLIVGTRQLADVPKLYGSEPPPNDSVWNIIRSKGFDVNVFKRNIQNKEKGVDIAMSLDVAKLLYKSSRPAGIIALVAGDADYSPLVDSIKLEKWTAEVWYWSNAANDIKRNASSFHSMDAHLYTIGFG